jgi:hypothetical protein
VVLFKRTYDRGYIDGMKEAVRIVIDVMAEMRAESEQQWEDELLGISPGGTDAEDD